MRKFFMGLAAAALAALGLAGHPAEASNCGAYTYTFSNGQIADANQVNANFASILSCVNANLAHNGANSDITSLSGLSTPLSVAQGGTALNSITSGNLIVGNGSSTPILVPQGVLLRSYIAGDLLSNDATSPNSVLDVAPGSAMDSTNAQMIVLGSTFYGSTGGSWVAGAGSGGSPVNKMGNGLSIQATTWYHVFAIVNAGAADIYFDTSATAANAPAGTTLFRRIGSFLTDGASHILPYYQDAHYFLWSVPKNDVSVANPGTSAALRTLSVPLGVRVKAVIGYVDDNGSTSHYDIVTSPDQADTAAAITSANCSADNTSGTLIATCPMEIWTNTSSQIRTRQSASGAGDTVNINTFGWYDPLGIDN